ncbi:Nramp family divalent metal transporter [Corynebacterium sp. P5848]|uniref:Nramp family divalent metal transporter n=1 Tax=Corynebacterium marambiense TaxID=2765364 RepID=UPI00226094B7|nr:Nramp family divalent metal transporter [Corynebacterium marambiense]MCX7542120.1 Nramp family divalent metal transporter [Corynebacterium marambiense]
MSLNKTAEFGAPTDGVVKRPLITLLGPAFIAAVAYVDPGNVAANISAGATYAYLLVWVLVLSNAMAVLIQYQSAKLGLVTGRSLPELLGERLGKGRRLAFWGQAELVAAATDLAEVVGGAIALNLLFDLPLVVGGAIVGAISMGLLLFQNPDHQRHFEFIIIGLLLIITVGFLSGLVISPPSATGVLGGLAPRFEDTNSVLLAASMLGATVMPHAIYLHSSLVNHRFPKLGRDLPGLLKATKHDVVWALVLAGTINIALLLLAASALGGVPGTDSIEGAHHAIEQALGPVIGVIFAIGLLASGLASTSVGAYAGSEIMAGLLHVRVPLVLRRAITLIPALLILWLYPDPSWALVLSQVALSFGIPFAIIPLARMTSGRELMGQWRDNVWVRSAMAAISVAIVALNFLLIYLTFVQ